jgi:hypothetical protein
MRRSGTMSGSAANRWIAAADVEAASSPKYTSSGVR